MRPLAVLCLLALAGVLAACSRTATGTGGRGDAAVAVVATTPQLGDFARQVGGARVTVHTILRGAADPHDFEPRPSDARAIAHADVVLQSGGDLDAWLGDLVDSAGGDARRVTLLDAVRPLRGDGRGRDAVDPHWWQDPRNAVLAVDRIRATLANADPGGRALYERRARAYARRIRALDAAIASCMRAIPASRRKLVTGHDAFGYFARRYDVEVLGSIIPARSSAAQPSAADVRKLVEAIRRERVRTIFPESALAQRLEAAVARDAGARVGPPLLADTLGGGQDATYLGALRHDAAAIARGLGGRCELPR